ncbi:MAG: winged helix-turn-helix domain-containing protein, partial [Myxococcota bacterium]
MTRRFGPFALDPDRRTLVGPEGAVDLQPKVFDLVALLSGAPDRIFTKAELLGALWPGVRVTEDSLHQSLRKARRALGDDPDRPRFVEAVPRRGWRWIAPVVEPPVTAGTLGREALVSAIVAASTPGSAVALHGPGGVGKTRVAVDAAPDAIRVGLAHARDRDDVVRAVADALALPAPTTDAAAAAIGRAIGGATVLLDEADAVPDAVGSLVLGWQAAAPAARWLITSRTRIPRVTTLEVPPLAPVHAAALLRLRTAVPLDPEDVDALVAELDGIPLAIELAASRLALLSPARMVDRLRAGVDVLSRGAGGGLWGSLSTSVALLTDPDRHLLAACAIVPGSFGVDDAEAAAPQDASGALDGLERLLDASLVARDGDRFAIAGQVRAFARALTDRDRTGAAGIAAWVAATAARAAERFPAALRWDADALAELRTMRDRLVVAHRTEPAPEVQTQLAVALGFGCRYGGPWELADRALASLVDPTPLARVLRAEYAIRLGRDPGDDLARVAADPTSSDAIVAFAWFLEARRAVASDPDRALQWAADAEARAGANDALAALALDVAGTVHRTRGAVDRVRDCFDRALGRVDHPAGRLARAIVSQNYASCLAALGFVDQAAARWSQALDSATSLPFPHLTVVARANLGTAMLAAGRSAEAKAPLEASLAEAGRVGDRASTA